MECIKYLAVTTTSENIILGIGVLGTWVIAALAIWGGPIRSRLSGPKLKIKLQNTKGDMTKTDDGTPLRYYHIDVINNRKSTKAINTRIQINKLLRPLADGRFKDEPLSTPMQLQWQFPNHKPQFLTLGYNNEVCDLGFIPDKSYFRLVPYVQPVKYDIALKGIEKFRIELVAIAENAESNKLNLEISWDGEWDIDSDRMSEHLVIREI